MEKETQKDPMPWMKLRLSYLNDVKLNKLPESAQLQYFKLYMLAFRADAGGELLDRETGEPYDIDDMAFVLRVDKEKLRKDILDLEGAKLLEQSGIAVWKVHRYEDEQENQKEARAAWAERQRNFRAKNKAKKSEDNLSKDKVSKDKSHPSVTRKSRVTDDRMTDVSDNSFVNIQAGDIKLPVDPDDIANYYDLDDVLNFYEKATGKKPSGFIQEKIKEFVRVDPSNDESVTELIKRKIGDTAMANPAKFDAYLVTCLNEVLNDWFKSQE